MRFSQDGATAGVEAYWGMVDCERWTDSIVSAINDDIICQSSLCSHDGGLSGGDVVVIVVMLLIRCGR